MITPGRVMMTIVVVTCRLNDETTMVGVANVVEICHILGRLWEV